MLDSIYHMTLKLFANPIFGVVTQNFAIYTRRCCELNYLKILNIYHYWIINIFNTYSLFDTPICPIH